MGYCAVMWGTTGYIGSMGVLQDKGGGTAGFCGILQDTVGNVDY